MPPTNTAVLNATANTTANITANTTNATAQTFSWLAKIFYGIKLTTEGVSGFLDYWLPRLMSMVGVPTEIGRYVSWFVQMAVIGVVVYKMYRWAVVSKLRKVLLGLVIVLAAMYVLSLVGIDLLGWAEGVVG